MATDTALVKRRTSTTTTAPAPWATSLRPSTPHSKRTAQPSWRRQAASSSATRPGPVGERPAGDALVGLDVAVAGGRNDIGRKGRGGGGLVPVAGVEQVPHGLLVERRGRGARLPGVGGPEAGRVGREHLVAQDELA